MDAEHVSLMAMLLMQQGILRFLIVSWNSYPNIEYFQDLNSPHLLRRRSYKHSSLDPTEYNGLPPPIIIDHNEPRTKATHKFADPHTGLHFV